MTTIATTTHPIDTFVAALASDPRAVHIERLAPRPARFGYLATTLPADVRDRLPIEHFWSHQAEAVDLVRSGRSVAIATGTASGKSLCYQAPIAESIVDGLRASTSLLLFPTKALAQDQVRAITDLAIPKLVGATYDGDSSQEERTWVRAHGNVVFTNPEMLHHGILPHHARWATYLMRLRYVVVDELHVLRGIFGTHVSHLLRRLRRICAHYGSSPTFVFTSATIGDPHRLASELCGLPVTPIVHDGSPRGERVFVLWNPARHSTIPRASGDGAEPPSPRRASANRDTAALVAQLVRDGHRTIAFCSSRKGTEAVAADIGRRLPPALADLVRPYRAGYLTAERREIEGELFSGRLRAVVATNALELGVDIGGLDACVLNGFPGTVSSMWQQAGRAGRGAQTSLAIVVAGDDQLDHWFMDHPDQLFERPLEPAVINPRNPFVLHPHLACAAYEKPLSHADEIWWPELLDDGVRSLVLDDRLRLRPKGRGSRREPTAVWAGRGWPSHDIGLRGGRTDEVRIALSDGTLIGTVSRDRACHLVHPGATYVHRGASFDVVELDLADGAAIVEASPGTEYTKPRSETQISILATDAARDVGRSRLSLGTVRVRSRVTGYKRHDIRTGEMLGAHDLFLPSDELVTRAFWYVVSPDLLDRAGLAVMRWPGTLHAVEHAAIGMLPLFTICDRWDVGGVSTAMHADTAAPTIVVYDAHQGGTGIAELGYGAADRHLQATLEVIVGCRCDEGCPSCVQSPKCGNGNEPLDKEGAAALLHQLLAEPPAAPATRGASWPLPSVGGRAASGR